MDSEKLFTQSGRLPTSGLTLEIKPSPLLVIIYLLFFLMVAISVFLLPIRIGFSLALSFVLLSYFQYVFRVHLLLNHANSLQKLVLTELNWCYVQRKNAQIFKADVLSSTFLTEYLVIINLREQMENEFFSGKDPLTRNRPSIFKTHSIILTAGSVDPGKFRQLKRYLRFISLSNSDEMNQEKTTSD